MAKNYRRNAEAEIGQLQPQGIVSYKAPLRNQREGGAKGKKQSLDRIEEIEEKAEAKDGDRGKPNTKNTYGQVEEKRMGAPRIQNGRIEDKMIEKPKKLKAKPQVLIVSRRK